MINASSLVPKSPSKRVVLPHFLSKRLLLSPPGYDSACGLALADVAGVLAMYTAAWLRRGAKIPLGVGRDEQGFAALPLWRTIRLPFLLPLLVNVCQSA